MGAITTVFISYIFLIFNYQAYPFFEWISLEIQPHCSNIFSEATYNDLLQSFICGQRLKNYYYLKTLQHSGVYHVLVVSGFHLNLVRIPLKSFLNRSSLYLEICVLLFYALMTGFNPPVVRSLIESIFPINNPTWRILGSWLGSLIINPLWILSPSLHLSLAARLAIALSTTARSPIATSLILFSILLPLIFSNHPLASCLSILSTPFLTFTLLLHAVSSTLLSLVDYLNIYSLAILIDDFDTLAVFLLNKSLMLLEHLSHFYNEPKSLRLLPARYTHFYLCALLTGLHFFQVKTKRNSLDQIKTKTPKVSSKLWVFILFLLFIFSPMPIKKDKFRPTKQNKVGILNLNRVPQAHNKHSHHKR